MAYSGGTVYKQRVVGVSHSLDMFESDARNHGDDDLNDNEFEFEQVGKRDAAQPDHVDKDVKSVAPDSNKR